MNSLRAAVAAYKQSREVSEAFVRLSLRDGTDNVRVEGLQGGPQDGWISIADYPIKGLEDVVVRNPTVWSVRGPSLVISTLKMASIGTYITDFETGLPSDRLLRGHAESLA